MKYLWKGSHSRIKELVLLFLGGFLFGVLFFWLFRNSFFEQLHEMNQKIAATAGTEQSFFSSLFYVVIEHTKSYGLLWLFSITRIRIPYMTFFIAYRGLGLGFLYSFFMMEYGMNGIRFALYYLFPHSLLLLPVFLLSFYKIYRRNGNHLLPFIVILYLVLLAACLLEVKFNIPLMNSLYKA